MEAYKTIYNYARVAFWFLYIATVLGVWSINPEYLDIVTEFLHIFIGIALVYFFNPWIGKKTTDFHKKIAFRAGIIILLSSSLKNILQNLPLIKKLAIYFVVM